MSLPVLTDDFLSVLIAQVRSFCPSLAGRVAGAAAFKEAITLAESANMMVPAGYVVPLDDEAEAISQNGSRHRLTDHFGVVVAISNRPDERGQQAATDAYGLRRELWRALIGFRPGADYDGIHYTGKTLLKMDRSRVWVQFEFSVYHEIGQGDTWQDLYQDDPDIFPNLETIHFGIDDIDPAADRNLQYPGPDGRIEFQFDINLPTDP